MTRKWKKWEYDEKIVYSVVIIIFLAGLLSNVISYQKPGCETSPETCTLLQGLPTAFTSSSPSGEVISFLPAHLFINGVFWIGVLVLALLVLLSADKIKKREKKEES